MGNSPARQARRRRRGRPAARAGRLRSRCARTGRERAGGGGGTTRLPRPLRPEPGEQSRVEPAAARHRSPEAGTAISFRSTLSKRAVYSRRPRRLCAGRRRRWRGPERRGLGRRGSAVEGPRKSSRGHEGRAVSASARSVRSAQGVFRSRAGSAMMAGWHSSVPSRRNCPSCPRSPPRSSRSAAVSRPWRMPPPAAKRDEVAANLIAVERALLGAVRRLERMLASGR